MYHRCYSNSALNPIWMVYNSVDKKHEGEVNMLALQVVKTYLYHLYFR